MNKQQENLVIVLERMVESVKANEDDAAMYAEYVDLMLDDMRDDDCFGTEGQCDPRGNHRDGICLSLEDDDEEV